MEQPVIPDHGTDTSGRAEFADESGNDGGRGEEGGRGSEWMESLIDFEIWTLR